MKHDYTYCLSEDCIHRRGCKRNLSNYTNDEVKQYANECQFATYFEEDGSKGECKESKPYPFQYLDRFRLSDGSELKTK